MGSEERDRTTSPFGPGLIALISTRLSDMIWIQFYPHRFRSKFICSDFDSTLFAFYSIQFICSDLDSNSFALISIQFYLLGSRYDFISSDPASIYLYCIRYNFISPDFVSIICSAFDSIIFALTEIRSYCCFDFD
jgi:hypothetical protein